MKKKLLANQLQKKITELKEDKLRQAITDFFKKEKELVLVAFDEYYQEVMLLQGHIDLILAPIHELQEEYYQLLLEHNLDFYHRGMLQAERLVKRELKQQALKAAKPVQFLHDKDKPTDLFGTIPYSEDYLERYTFTATEKTMSRVDSEINRILTDGYKEGWGVKDVRNRIMERYDQFSSWEANRIARTEMQTAHNMGMMHQYQEMGVEYKKWRSAHDSRVRGHRKTDRANHIIMDEEIAPLDEPFSNGLMYPGDKSGPIEEWINCRCSAVPYLMGPGEMAPVGRTNFRETDIVNTTQPDYNELLLKETKGAVNWEQYRQVLHGKSLEELGILLQNKQQEEVYQEPSEEFTKWIDYIREGNWKDPEKMLEKIESLGYRKTNKLTQAELESLQLEALYYYNQARTAMSF